MRKKSVYLDELLQHIQIEAEARRRYVLTNCNKNDGIHNVDASASKAPKGKQGSLKKRKHSSFQKNENKNDNKKSKFGPCFVCGKPGHTAKVCCFWKGINKEETNLVESDFLLSLLKFVWSIPMKIGGWIPE